MTATLNALLHALHIAVIVFSCTGWISAATRPAHLVLSALIALSWFVLGPLSREGLGFCAITGLQHRIWRRQGRPTPGYIVFLVQRIRGRDVDPALVASVTQWVFYATTALSLALHLGT